MLSLAMGFGVTCESCQKRLEIPDSLFEAKFKGRIVSITCRSCRAPIRIDGTLPWEASAPDAPESSTESSEVAPELPSVVPLATLNGESPTETAEAALEPLDIFESAELAPPSSPSTVPAPPPWSPGQSIPAPVQEEPSSVSLVGTRAAASQTSDVDEGWDMESVPAPMAPPELLAPKLASSEFIKLAASSVPAPSEHIELVTLVPAPPSSPSELIDFAASPAPAPSELMAFSGPASSELRDAVASSLPAPSFDGTALDLELALKLLPQTSGEDEQTRVEANQWRQTVVDADGEEAPLSLREPVATIGRYSLFDKFAVGGMATIHFGRLDGAGGFSRVVALKRLLPHLIQNDEFVEMLLKEARLAGRVRHPNVVPTLDVVASKGEVLIVLEYVHGESLSALCRRHADQRELIPIEVVVSVMIDVLTGLHAVHEATDERGRPLGLVHRDVSPANVIVGIDGLARVLDFGIVKALELVEETIPNRLKGKTGYMSPEQTRGDRVTRRSDVFSAGIVLYELLTLHRFASGKTEKERMDRILSGEYERPSSHRPEVPAALSDVVMKALAFDPGDRYGTALEVAEALQVALPGASKGTVTDWVRRLAASSLAERARMVAQVENWNGARERALQSTPYTGETEPREPENNPRSPVPALSRPFSIAAETRSGSPIPLIAVVALGCLILYLLARLG